MIICTKSYLQCFLSLVHNFCYVGLVNTNEDLSTCVNMSFHQPLHYEFEYILLTNHACYKYIPIPKNVCALYPNDFTLQLNCVFIVIHLWQH